MPRKYRATKKAPFAKRLYKAGKYAYKHRSTAVKAFQLAKKVARMVNVEYKFVPIEIAGQSVTQIGTVIPFLDNLPQGDGSTDREGDSIKLMRFSCRGFITQNASAQKTAVRVILFRGKQENAQPYLVQDILDAQNYTNNLFLAPKSFSEKFRSKILFDKVYHMSNNGNSSIIFNWNFKLYGHANYEQSSTGVENGGLYILVIGNEGTNHPTFNLTGKITFTDN